MGAWRAVLLLGAASSLLRASSSGGSGDPPAPAHAGSSFTVGDGSSFTVGVDWASPALTTASTAPATAVEVDSAELLRHGLKHDDVDARPSPAPFDPPLMLWDGACGPRIHHRLCCCSRSHTL